MKTYLIIIAVASLITLLMYYDDKRKAEKNKWRTPEKALLLASVLGGSLGGVIAMYTFRHKNKHWYFVVVNIVSFIIHIALGVFLYTRLGF